MKASKKRGFTIIELVIVIAVVAILAAVLIPVFSNVVQQAKEANDTVMVRNLNTALKTDGKKHSTMTEALDAAKGAGYDVTKISNTASNNEILWDSVNDCFVYMKDGKINYIPDSKTETVAAADTYKYFRIFATTEGVADSEYSVYLAGTSATGDITVKSGFDAGENAGITSVTYAANAGHEVVVRTNGGTLNVNAATDTVNHYGDVEKVVITAVAGDSYHENGVVSKSIIVSSGRVVLEKVAEVKQINIVEATSAVKVEANVPAIIVADEQSKELTSVVANAENVLISGIDDDKIGGSNASDSIKAVEVNSTAALKSALLKSGFYKVSESFELTEVVTVSESANVVIDFNGKTITYKDDWLWCNYGDLTVIDTVGGGKISVGKGAFLNLGSLTINGGEIEATTRGGSTIKNGGDLNTPMKIYPEAKLIINDVTINTNNNFAVYNVTYFELNGGSLQSTSSNIYGSCGYCINSVSEYAMLVINGGEVTGVQGAIAVVSGKAIINDVSASTSNTDGKEDSFYALYVAGETGTPSCTVNGGTFIAGQRQALYVGNKADGGEGNLAMCTVNGGTFISPEGVSSMNVVLTSENNYGLGYITISGGQFSTDVSGANGVTTCIKNDQGLWIVNAN